MSSKASSKSRETSPLLRDNSSPQSTSNGSNNESKLSTGSHDTISHSKHDQPTTYGSIRSPHHLSHSHSHDSLNSTQPSISSFPPLKNSALQEQPKHSVSRFNTALSNNRGLIFVFIAQFFASTMALTTRYLSTSLPPGQKFHAFQILFVRMSITTLFCMVWMWYNNVPHFPWGQKSVRGLLIIRGCAGFIGVYGLYYSLQFLPLPDATVITFLVPTSVSLICSLIPSLNEPFTRGEKIGGIISLVGVTIIARPTFLFPPSPSTITFAMLPPPGTNPPITPTQRLLAVLTSLIGVLGASIAYTTIRVIGHRAHPLVSVTYFSLLTTVISFLSLVLLPTLSGGIILPQGYLQWGLLGGIGVSGFLMQFFLTRGLQLEKAGRAGSLVYTQMVWAVVFEWVVWGDTLGGLSAMGGGLVLVGVVGVNWRKWVGGGGGGATVTANVVAPVTLDEERSLIGEEQVEIRPELGTGAEESRTDATTKPVRPPRQGGYTIEGDEGEIMATSPISTRQAGR